MNGNLQCFWNEYIPQPELIVEIFLWLSLHSGVFLEEENLEKNKYIVTLTCSYQALSFILYSPNSSPFAAYSVTK